MSGRGKKTLNIILCLQNGKKFKVTEALSAQEIGYQEE